MTTPAETFPASIPTTTHRCDYCGHERAVAHVRIASEVDTWLLCVACIRANHTDDEVPGMDCGVQRRMEGSA